MITNDRQYKIIKGQIEQFQESLDQFSATSADVKDVHPEIIKAQKDAIQFKLNQLLADAKEYEDLKEGRVVITQVKDLNDLPLALIKARIANGLTQADLAEKLGLKAQQIQKYEAEKYETASLRTLQKVSGVLGIDISADVQIKEIEAPDIYNVKKYPFRQMFQQKWFPNFAGTLNDAVQNSDKLIAELYFSAGIRELQPAFNKTTIRSGSEVNVFALNAWYAKVLLKARGQELTSFFNKKIVSSDWLSQLAQLSSEPNGPISAIEFLRASGVRVVIEPHLEGTHIDGAALLLDEIYPVIALSLRYDRLDNFWFVLFHELAHIILHLNSEVKMIFDDLDVKREGIEEEADKYALNAIIPDDIWKISLARFSPSENTILNQAKKLKIHPALVAGRIRWEKGEYYLYNDLIGQGKVRQQFANEI
ncbi:MAG TPA: XRE family transcriptional regulator [Chitinophagaceae bacterium]|nr:XRE family transcriptional regulator [Chitinophagaceae bacterium]